MLEYSCQLHAHNGSGFDTRIVLSNLPRDKRIFKIVINDKVIFELKMFIGHFKNNRKQIPQNLQFRCGLTHLNYSLKKYEELSKTKKNC